MGSEGASYRRITRAIVKEDGFGGLYRGFVPNAIKNLPNKGESQSICERRCQGRAGIRLSTFDGVKRLLAASERTCAELAASSGDGQRLE